MAYQLEKNNDLLGVRVHLYSSLIETNPNQSSHKETNPNRPLGVFVAYGT
jgi:hypothetical protein